MKVFFTGSPRALKKYRPEHEAIFNVIQKLGHKQLSDLVITADYNTFYDVNRRAVVEHYKRTIQNLKNADVVIVEASTHSLSMGYLIDKALEHNKPVIILHLYGLSPFFLAGLEDERLQVVEYSLETVDKVVSEALSYAVSQSDIRFNFFISPKIANFLDWMSREKRIPRSVYLRRLIENDMSENTEYQAAA